jgi:hypothetical protein
MQLPNTTFSSAEHIIVNGAGPGLAKAPASKHNKPRPRPDLVGLVGSDARAAGEIRQHRRDRQPGRGPRRPKSGPPTSPRHARRRP